MPFFEQEEHLPEADTASSLALFDASLTRLLGGFDPPVDVRYNRRVLGRLSRSPRRVDVLVRGSVLGVWVSVAVECVQRPRPVDVGVVDRFAGKLLDIGADRGVLYSCAGFTERARRRAAAAQCPPIMAISLAPFDDASAELPPHDSAAVSAIDFALFLRIGGSAGLWQT